MDEKLEERAMLRLVEQAERDYKRRKGLHGSAVQVTPPQPTATMHQPTSSRVAKALGTSFAHRPANDATTGEQYSSAPNFTCEGKQITASVQTSTRASGPLASGRQARVAGVRHATHNAPHHINQHTRAYLQPPQFASRMQSQQLQQWRQNGIQTVGPRQQLPVQLQAGQAQQEAAHYAGRQAVHPRVAPFAYPHLQYPTPPMAPLQGHPQDRSLPIGSPHYALPLRPTSCSHRPQSPATMPRAATGQVNAVRRSPGAPLFGLPAGGGPPFLSLSQRDTPTPPRCQVGGGSVQHGMLGQGSGMLQQTGAGARYRAVMELSTDGLIVQLSGYHDRLTDVCRRLKGTHVAGNRWRFDTQLHDELVRVLTSEGQGVHVVVDPLPALPRQVVQVAQQLPNHSARYQQLPASLREALLPFQRKGVQFGLSRGCRVLIGDEMGLGKTVQACALIYCYREKWPVLIVTPASLRDQWADALHTWLNVIEQHMHVVYTKADVKEVAKTATFKSQYKALILGYEWISKMEQELEALKPSVVVCDEAHYLKSHKTQRTKSMSPVMARAEHVVLLSGTPALSRPIELFPLIQGLLPEAKVKVTEFGDRYCEGDQFNRYKGCKNTEELHAVLTQSIMLRRRKADVLTELPKKIRQQVHIRLGPEGKSKLEGVHQQLGGLRRLVADMEDADSAESLLQTLNSERRHQATEMFHQTAELKVGPVQNYLESVLLQQDTKFLLFAHHRVMLDGCERSLNKGKVGYIRIDGSTPQQVRGPKVNQFQEEEDCRVALLSIQAAGVGLTLTAASTVVFAEMSWVPAQLVQAEDRAHRIGQNNMVLVQYLILKDSVDEVMWRVCNSKLQNVGTVLDGKEDKLQVNSIAQKLDEQSGSLLPHLQSDNQQNKSSPSQTALAPDRATPNGSRTVTVSSPMQQRDEATPTPLHQETDGNSRREQEVKGAQLQQGGSKLYTGWGGGQKSSVDAVQVAQERVGFAVRSVGAGSRGNSKAQSVEWGTDGRASAQEGNRASQTTLAQYLSKCQ